MRRNTKTTLALQFLSLFFLIACNSSHSPDLILTNGKIITVDKDFTKAEVVAIEKEMIIAVG